MTSYSCNTSFLDLLFNMLLAFAAMFVLAFAMVSEKKPNNKDGVVDSKAEFLVTLTWPGELDDDMDLWVEDPEGNLCFFQRRETGLMNLDRDDLGRRNDIVMTEDGQIEVLRNQEVVAIRGIMPGEYVVNAHAYFKNSKGRIEVSVKVEKINPYSIVLEKQLQVDASGEEKTAGRFTVAQDGSIKGTSSLAKPLTRRDYVSP